MTNRIRAMVMSIDLAICVAFAAIAGARGQRWNWTSFSSMYSYASAMIAMPNAGNYLPRDQYSWAYPRPWEPWSESMKLSKRRFYHLYIHITSLIMIHNQQAEIPI